jgi:purine-binding chemotaxis protein CheW
MVEARTGEASTSRQGDRRYQEQRSGQGGRADASARGESLQLVGFRIGEEEYAINILEIVGVDRPENILQLPKMPPFIAGVMRIRDEVVPLIRLRTRFGFEERPADSQTRVIVISMKGHEGPGDQDAQDDERGQTVGYIVDSVTSVYRLGWADVEDAPAMALTVESRFVDGVVNMDDRMIILLNPYEILREDETSQLERASAVAEYYAAAKG